LISGGEIAVSNGGVAMAVTTATGLGEEIWMVRGDGSGTLPLTGRWATAPAFSPRGREVYYFSRRGLGGRELGSYDLRAVDQDGSNDRLIASGLPGPGELYFSPYVQRALLAIDSTLHVIGLDGSEMVRLDISTPALDGTELAGWIDNARDEALFVKTGPSGREEMTGLDEIVLLALSLESGRTREMYRAFIAPAGYEPIDQPAYGWREYPVPVATREESASGEPGMRIDLVSLVSGEITTLAETTCFSGTFSSSSSRLTYVRCAATDSGSSEATVLMRDMRSGEENVVSRIDLGEGSVRMIESRAVAGGDDAALIILEQKVEPGGQTMAVVLGPEGHRLSMLPGWIPVGLSGSTRVFLVDSLERVRTIASGDVRTGMLQVIFP
jgi:hypothetical protein